MLKKYEFPHLTCPFLCHAKSEIEVFPSSKVRTSFKSFRLPSIEREGLPSFKLSKFSHIPKFFQVPRLEQISRFLFHCLLFSPSLFLWYHHSLYEGNIFRWVKCPSVKERKDMRYLRENLERKKKNQRKRQKHWRASCLLHAKLKNEIAPSPKVWFLKYLHFPFSTSPLLSLSLATASVSFPQAFKVSPHSKISPSLQVRADSEISLSVLFFLPFTPLFLWCHHSLYEWKI